jgi:hypothetical protein
MLPGAALYHQHLTEAARLSHELMGNDKDSLRAELEETAFSLARPGRGLLAADESVGTIGKRLVAAGLENEEETRRAYREVLFAHPDLGQYLRCVVCLAVCHQPLSLSTTTRLGPRATATRAKHSGAILHSETLGQKAADGTPFPELLKAKGVLPGVKVSMGCAVLYIGRASLHAWGKWGNEQAGTRLQINWNAHSIPNTTRAGGFGPRAAGGLQPSGDTHQGARQHTMSNAALPHPIDRSNPPPFV